ncbi:MAG TPA: hypothetical protein PK904_12535 [Bacteroidales bacterium]|nr:hypothetical protein [Bacteroidales bacterium]
MLQIGKIILNKIKETNQTPAAIARKMQISRTGLYTMLATNDFKLSRLQQLSQELNHNFFQYYIPTNQPDQTAIKELQTQKNILQLQNEYLQKENAHLREMLNFLKEKIS